MPYKNSSDSYFTSKNHGLSQVITFISGGGAIEMELSKHLRNLSRTIAGKEQLLMGAMAKALEVIPRQLCENAGFDATNILNKLRQRHAQGKFICFPGSKHEIIP